MSWWDANANSATWWGLIISLVGFGFTIASVRKSQNAAEAAKIAADATLKSIGKLDVIAALSLSVRTLTELHEMHRNNVWVMTPRQLRSVSSSLVEARSASFLLKEQDQTIIQSVITQLKTLIEAAENKINDPGSDTSLVSKIIDEQTLALGEILGRIRHNA